MTWKVSSLEELAKIFEQYAANEDTKQRSYLKTKKEIQEAKAIAATWRDAAGILRDTVIEPRSYIASEGDIGEKE